jgi:cytochrome c-type biogenesis protein CcmH/NrfG
MQTPGARLAGAAIVLAFYYWALIAKPATAPAFMVEAQLQQDIQSSLALFSTNRFADALAPTQRIVERWPSQAMYHERLAVIFQKLDRPADEALEWEAMMGTSPTPIDACPMVANAYRRSNREDQALDAFSRCAALQPANPDFQLLLGQALLRAERKAEARQAFERGLEIDASYPDLHLVIGIRQFDDGQFPQARASFERFLALAPERRDEVAVWLERTEKAK